MLLIIWKVSFSSWTYDRFLSNASIEKKDLSLLGFITGILCIISILSSLIVRMVIDFYENISLSSSDEIVVQSPSILSSTTTDKTSEL